MSLSQNIKNLRTAKGLTQEQLAAELGVSAQAVSKWETSETYPDGALLVPLANALETSLDVLFDNKAHSMKDITVRIRDIIAETPEEDRFHIVRDICWQIEKGLFNCYMPIAGKYKPDEIKKAVNSSAIINNFGFTHIANNPSKFFMVFPEYDGCFSKVIGDGEEIGRILAAMSSPDTMKALIFLYKQNPSYLFDAEILTDTCGVVPEKLDEVITDLLYLNAVSKRKIEIDGKMRTLYSSIPHQLVVAIWLIANELRLPRGYQYHSDHRSEPYLK